MMIETSTSPRPVLNLVQTSQAPRHPDDATADQEGVSEKDLVALRRALTRRFWMLPNPFLKRPSESQAHAYISLTKLILIGDEPAASMCSSTIISLDRIDYWVACECKWDNSGDTTAVLKHWARALCRMSSYSSRVTCDVRSFCMHAMH